MSQQQISADVLNLLGNAEAHAKDAIEAENTLAMQLPEGLHGTCTFTALDLSVIEAKGTPGEKGYKPKCLGANLKFVIDSPDNWSGKPGRTGTALRKSPNRTEEEAYKSFLDTCELAGYPRERRVAFSSYQEVFTDIMAWIDEDSRTSGFRTVASMSNGVKYVNVQFCPPPESPSSSAQTPSECVYQGVKVKVVSEEGALCIIEYLEGSKQGETKEVPRADLTS